VNQQVHQDNNRTGEPSFNVMYSSQPDWNDPYCQWGNTSTAAYDISAAIAANRGVQQSELTGFQTLNSTSATTTTQCISTTGAIQPAVTVNVTNGTPDSTTGISQIATVTSPTASGSSGQYYLYPMMNGTFSGLLQLINSANGHVMVDETMNQRYILVIMDASQCNTTIFPTGVPSGCAVGNIYNVNSSWNCNNNPCTVSITANAAQAAASINQGTAPTGSAFYTLTPTYQTNQINTSNGGIVGVQASTGATGPTSTGLEVTVDATTGAVLTAAKISSGTTADSGSYTVSPNWSCNSNGCTNNGYYLLDSTGAPFTASGSLASGLTASSSQILSVSSGVTMYTDAYFVGLGSIFPYSDTGTGSWHLTAQMIQVNMGPAANTTYDCSLDPFYLAADPTSRDSGTITSTVDPTTGNVTCGSLTFASTMDVIDYLFDDMDATNYGNTITNCTAAGGNITNGQAIPLACRPHQHAIVSSDGGYSNTVAQANLIGVNMNNSYNFSDPGSVTSLLNTAFGPMLDGRHTLTTSTNLNALQAFGLVYIFMSGQSNTHNINGLLSSGSTTYEMATPMFSSSGNGGPPADLVNSAIGNAFLTFHK